MTERDGWGLRGPVRACQLQRTWRFRQCGADACETEERSDITNLEFRADGSLVRRWHHNSDGSEWTATYEYNDAGRLARVRTENGAGLLELKIYDYDTAGRLVRVTAQPQGRGDRIDEIYEYDAAGRKKKTVYVDLAIWRANTFWGVEGTDSSYSAPGAATLTTLYNDRDQPTDLLFSDGTARLLSRVEFVYDSHGNLVEEAQTNSAETLPPEMLTSLNPAQVETVRALFCATGEPIRRMHRYDEAGRRTETRSRVGLLGGDRKTVAYNNYGDQIEETWEHEQREYGIDDEGRLSNAPTSESTTRSEARFRYDYDARGNWVMKTVESRGGEEQDFTPSTIERRALTYFD